MILAFVGDKGGIGKSTMVTTVGYELSTRGEKTLLVDTDFLRSLLKWNSARGEDLPLPDKLHVIGMSGDKLHKDINKIIEDYDHIIIDTPGGSSSGAIARSAAVISDVVIIPCICSVKAIRSIQDTITLMKEIKITQKKLKVFFLFNQVDATSSMRKKVEPIVMDLLGDEITLMKTEMSKRVLYDKADLNAMTIQEVDKNKEVLGEIRSLIEEIEQWKRN